MVCDKYVKIRTPSITNGLSSHCELICSIELETSSKSTLQAPPPNGRRLGYKGVKLPLGREGKANIQKFYLCLQ